jgi:hypothetical protein
MSPERIYENNAERQRAYRNRHGGRASAPAAPAQPVRHLQTQNHELQTALDDAKAEIKQLKTKIKTKPKA